MKHPVPILALDTSRADAALALLDRLPEVEWVKVGLQLFTATGPDIVKSLRARGLRVFLDLKLHDIPNTVAGAVESAAALDVDLLTVHAAGGEAMLRAASDTARSSGTGLRLLAVTLLTSLSGREVATVWGRGDVSAPVEVRRLARLARDGGMDGVVASVHEVGEIQSELGSDLILLTPGIRLPGDSAGDQTRIATPADAARLGIDYIVIGRTVTAAVEPSAAWNRVLKGIIPAAGE